MLRKQDVIISKVKSQIRKTMHKYGIEMATSVDHAYEVNKGNGNTLWRDTIKKEMTNVGNGPCFIVQGIRPSHV